MKRPSVSYVTPKNLAIGTAILILGGSLSGQDQHPPIHSFATRPRPPVVSRLALGLQLGGGAGKASEDKRRPVQGRQLILLLPL